MKKLALLTLLLCTSWSAFSQSLKPTVHVASDTLLCFTVPQAKTLSKIILNGIFSDSIARHLEAENTSLEELSVTKDSIIASLERKESAQEVVRINQGQMLQELQERLSEKDAALAKQQKHTKILGSALGLVILLLIIL